MKITFYGAAEEVGRSCIMVSTSKTKILLDAGVKPGEVDGYPTITDDELRKIDGIFISHSHLDHCCYLPHIYSAGYKGDTYTTKPTMELINVLIPDYMKISAPMNVTKEGLEKLGKHYKVIEYRKPFKFKDLTIEFMSAGHLVGSSLIKVSDGQKSIVYTGDINLANTRLLEGADLKNVSADTLITESTYGGKKDMHANEKDTARDMIKSIKDTIVAGGKVIIPSFAVGRAQEVLLFLDDYMNSGQLPKVPIYVDGMINKALRIHRHNVIYCRKEIQSRILMSDYDPFKSENFVIVEDKRVRSKAAEDNGSCIIVTTSGMLTGGPVIFYLKKLARNSMNKLILVGYQVEGTPGRTLQDGAKELDFHDTKLKINLKVETYPMSAHADRKQLETIPKKIKGIKEIFIVHGEKGKSDELKAYFDGKFKVIVPKLGSEYSI